MSLAVQHTTTNRSVYFDYFLKGLWWVVIGMGTDNLSELCCSVFLSCCTYCFLCFECRFNVGSCFWVGTVRLNTYIYLVECAGRVSWGYLQCSVFTYSMFLILNTCFDLRAFSNRLLKSLLFWGTRLRFGSQPLSSSSVIFTIVGNSVSSSTPKLCKSQWSCSATKIWQVDFRFSLSGCEGPVPPS